MGWSGSGSGSGSSLDEKEQILNAILFVPVEHRFKAKKRLQNKLIVSSQEGWVKKNFFFKVDSLHYIGAGAGAG